MSNQPLQIFIGFDHRSHVGYHACHQSILARASKPVSITPLVLPSLPILRTGLTEFTFTRFLTPWLRDYRGRALFMDSDIIVQADINQLWELTEDDSKAAWCVPYEGPLAFERAGVIMFNCGHQDCKKLTPEFVDKTDSNLHKFDWTDNLGSLPMEWGHLVMYQQPTGDIKLIHYTAGLPVYPETAHLGFKDEFVAEAQRMTSTVSWREIMGNSVHAKHVLQILDEKNRKENADALAKAAFEQAQVA